MDSKEKQERQRHKSATDYYSRCKFSCLEGDRQEKGATEQYMLMFVSLLNYLLKLCSNALVLHSCTVVQWCHRQHCCGDARFTLNLRSVLQFLTLQCRWEECWASLAIAFIYGK